MADTLKPKRRSGGLGRLGNGAAAGSGGGPAGPGVPVRRRWGRVAAGLGAAVVGMWAFAALYMSAGDKEEVLVVGSGVQRYEQVTTSDLTRVRVSLEPGADSISVSDEDDFIGRLAATELIPGTVLTEDHFLDDDAEVVSASEEVVGARLSDNEFPARNAQPGDAVKVVIRGSAGVEGDEEPVEAWLLEIGSPDENSGERSLSLVVPTNSADDVSAASADDRISVNLLDG